MSGWLWRLLCRLGLCREPEVHYIGGSDTLPPPLSREREAELLGRLDQEDARQELIEHNLRLVVYIARRFENTGINIEDLISIGTIGLIKAVGTYRADKNIKLATGTQLMAQDRAIVDEAYAGDIIGLFDPGIFSIGDTLCTGKKKIEFAGIPTFSPEHFARIEQKDTMKRKQFVKGMEQIAQEGAIQIFREVGGGMEEVVVGVVGVLQLEVLEYRLNTEYNVEIRMQQLPFEQLRWIQNDPDTYVLRDLDLTSDTKAVEDMKGNRLLLFTSDWAIRWAETHNETLKLSEFGNI